jgi:hypothetical protein
LMILRLNIDSDITLLVFIEELMYITPRIRIL